MDDYERIYNAIEFIKTHRSEQPDLAAIAQHLNLSSGYVQKLFIRWAGITPKRFLQALTIEDAKLRLAEGQSILAASEQAGLSSASRLYDHFIELEAITPGEFKSGGAGQAYSWAHVATPFGMAFLAFSNRGVCQLSFTNQDDLDQVLNDFKRRWHAATIDCNQEAGESLAESIFSNYLNQNAECNFKLRVYGTNFQVAVWRALLRQPWGKMTSYSDIAKSINKPKAVRAVGTAIGANPIACLIPCHRVIQQSGALGGYRWGLIRKQAILLKELGTA